MKYNVFEEIKPKVFDPKALNFYDLLICVEQLEYTQKIILSLNHMLEDCDLDGVTMVKIAKLIKLWRKERRYWKILWRIKNHIGGYGTIRKIKNQIEYQKDYVAILKNKSNEDIINFRKEFQKSWNWFWEGTKKFVPSIKSISN